MLPLGSCSADEPTSATSSAPAVVVVLGNEPLDDATPTVDTVARVETAVEFQRQHPGTLLLFTGGSTAGTNTEARMMADLAIAQGASTNSIRIEEKARTTQENARFTAELVRAIRPQRILIASKAEHLEWAMPVFQRLDVFQNAEPLPCKGDRAASIVQMEQYLKMHPGNERVRERLRRLKEGVKGTD
mgnify:CR=1 FL=1